MSKSKTSELSQLVELLALIEELGIENLMELLKATVEGADEEPKKAGGKGKKAKGKAKPADDADEDDGDDDEGDDDGDDDEEPKKAGGKGKGKAKAKAKCPFKVGDKVELYDEESASWDYASTIEEIDGTTLTVILDDGDDDDPVEVEVAEDFSDVRLKKASKKKGKLSRGKK